MDALPPELLILTPLALAAGVDLYLTLLLIGAAPTMGLWATPLAGALGDLDSPGVLIMVGTFYILEFAAERFPPTALVWNAFHAVIRPVSGFLLALLILDGQPTGVMVGGALFGAALSSIAHAIRSGHAVVRWLGALQTPSVLLVSLAEDALVIGIVSLALDAPAWAFGCALAILIALTPVSFSFVRAFAYAVGLVGGRVFQTLRERRWRDPEELPEWVSRAVTVGSEDGPGGAIRGSAAGALHLPGTPIFALGWVVVQGGSPVFVFKRWWRSVNLEISDLKVSRVVEDDWMRRVDVASGTGSACILFNLSGPSAESLHAELHAPERRASRR